MKHVEEAVAIRDRLLTAFDRAAALPPGPERRRLLTVTVRRRRVLRRRGLRRAVVAGDGAAASYPELSRDDLHFHLVEAQGRILPEVVATRPGAWVVRSLEKRGARVT